MTADRDKTGAGARGRVATLMYHDLVGSEEGSGFRVASARSYQLTVPQFVAHLDAIERGSLHPDAVLAVPPDRDALLLTFDDGGVSAMRVADLLDARSWKGHFFITTGFVGKPGFVTRGDILDLHRRGHVIGSHSHTHPNICYNLADAEMLAEWQISCAALSEMLAAPVTTASVPGGDMGRRTAATAAQAGIEFLFTSEPTLNPWPCEGVTCFGRVCLMGSDPPQVLEQLLQFKGYGRRRAVRWGKQLAKRLLASLYRARMPKTYLGAQPK